MNGVLVRPRLDMNAVLEEYIRGTQDVLPLVAGIGQVMESPVPATMLLCAGKIVCLIVHGEPTATKPAVVEENLLGDA